YPADHSGRYRIRGSTVCLQLHSPPTNTSLSVIPGEEVVEGQQVTFVCSSEGAPLPRLVLSRNGRELQSVDRASTMIFDLPYALLEHSDVYQCVASNLYGSQQASSSITVRDPPRNTSLSIRPGEELVEGRHVTFSCHSDGAPAPALVLSRNGMELRRIKPATSSPLTFTFSPILLEHSDLYRCECHQVKEIEIH
uniref:Ig-like domain-containing protein n=1 Tax=Oreochromis niloticus TaxID=8128 RepID=A0A669E8M7_ORENI